MNRRVTSVLTLALAALLTSCEAVMGPNGLPAFQMNGGF